MKVCCFLMLLVFVNAVIVGQPSSDKESSQVLIERIKAADEQAAVPYEKRLMTLPYSEAEQAKNLMELGRYFYKQGTYKRSLHYINKAIVLAQASKEDVLLGEVYLMQGNSYLLDWQNQRALDAYHKVLSYTKKTRQLNKNVIAKINIAIINRRMNQLNQSIASCLNALKIVDSTSLRHTKNHVNLLTIISDSYLDLGEYGKTLEYAETGVAISSTIDYRKGLADLYTKIGHVYCKKGDHALGTDYFDKALTLIKKEAIAESYFMENIHFFTAISFHDQGRYKEAIIPLLALTHSATKVEGRQKYRTIEAHKLLADSYKQLGDTENSAKWYDTYITLNEAYLEKKDEVVNKIYEKDTQQLGAEIQFLKQEYVVQQKRNKYLWLGGLLVTLTLGVLLLLHLKRPTGKNNKEAKPVDDRSYLLDPKPESASAKPVGKEILINSIKVEEVLKRLEKLENQEYFLTMGCNLRAMAKKVKTNATYLSLIINQYKDKKFVDYINDLRIDYAIERLKKDKKFRSFSVKSIASEVGYKSDYSFAKHFKSKTGLNPSDYIKKLRPAEPLATT